MRYHQSIQKTYTTTIRWSMNVWREKNMFQGLNGRNLQDISEGTNVRSLLIGLATTAFAGLCFTSANTMVKLLPPGSSYDILLLRSLIQVQHEKFWKFAIQLQILFPKSSNVSYYSSNSFSKMQLMLPLVIRADTGFYGTEDLATRLAKKTITLYD